jgi:uncharacterized OsmC-like protein
MNYRIEASSISNKDAIIHIKHSNIAFGTTSETAETLPNPAELLLGAFSACMLKNLERFSGMMNFTYTKATVEVNATRLENPPRMDTDLLKKNIAKFGTIYNTIKISCTISGTIKTIADV